MALEFRTLLEEAGSTEVRFVLDSSEPGERNVLSGTGGVAHVPALESLSVDIRESVGPGPEFVRGDANNDLSVNLSDGVSIFQDLFLGLVASALYRDALDADDSGDISITDGIYILNFLFSNGPTLPLPYPDAGTDPSDDRLPPCRPSAD